MVRFLGPQSPTDGSFNVRTYGAKGDGTTDDSAAIQRALDAASASIQGSTPTYVSAGTVASGTGATTSPGLPASYAAGDIFLMFVETMTGETQAAPSGWEIVSGFPIDSTGSTASGATTLNAFWRRATSSETSPTLADPGDHNMARIFAFRGCRRYGVPWDTTATSAKTTFNNTVALPTITTNTSNVMYVGVASGGVDSTFETIDWTLSGGLPSISNLGSSWAGDGNGGGFGVVTGTVANPGSVAGPSGTFRYNNQLAAQSVIALAPEEGPGGATVVIPPGNYKLNTQLNIRSCTTLLAHGAYLWSGNANYLLVCNYSNAYAFNGGHSIEVHGGTWDGKAQDAAADAAYNVMGFYHCSNIGVHDLNIRNVASWHGFEYNSTRNSIIERVRFEGFRDTTTAQSRQFSAAIQIDLATNDYTCSKDITVQNCYVGKAQDGSGLDSFGRGFDSHTDQLGYWYTGIKILDNTVEDTIQQGIQTYSWNDSIISGNVLKNIGISGIKVAGNAANDVKALTISGNVIDTTGEAGIEVADVSSRKVYNSTISNNVLENCSPVDNSPGMYLRFMFGCTISGNSLRGGANIGISIFDSTSIAVTSNSLRNIGHDAFRLNAGCASVVVSNNVVDTTPQRGVYITGSGCTNSSVIGNLFLNCGSALGANGVMENSSTTGADNSFIGNRVIKGTGASSYGFKTQVASTVCVGNSFKGWSAYPLNGTAEDSIDAAATANQWTA